MKRFEFDYLVNSTSGSTSSSNSRGNRRNAVERSRARLCGLLLCATIALMLLLLIYKFAIGPAFSSADSTPLINPPITTTTTTAPRTGSRRQPMFRSETTTQSTRQRLSTISVKATTATVQPPLDADTEILMRAGEVNQSAAAVANPLDSSFDIHADLKQPDKIMIQSILDKAQNRTAIIGPKQSSGTVDAGHYDITPTDKVTNVEVASTTTAATKKTTTADDENFDFFMRKTTQWEIRTSTSSPIADDFDIDDELKNVIEELDSQTTPIPVWRIQPEEEYEVTAPPLPPRVQPKFNVQATVQSHIHDVNYQHRLSQTPVIVTALVDIGRGDWIRFTRPYDLYLSYLMDLLKMDNRMIIYCDEPARDFLLSQNNITHERLQIITITLHDLPLFRYHDEVVGIIDGEQKHWKWDLRFKQHPEALYPEYNILVNSKPYFMYNATQISRFDSEFFVWVDAGYSHGSSDVIPPGLWDPEIKRGKITTIKITPEVDRAERYTLDLIYRKHTVVMSGGFLAGDVSTIRRFNTFFLKTFIDLLNDGKVDDDQTTLLMTIREYRSIFHILSGGWFHAFKLVPTRY